MTSSAAYNKQTTKLKNMSYQENEKKIRSMNVNKDDHFNASSSSG